ncbi:D-glycero-beta-D-manno-heptose-7-phosphate kinase [Maricaulis sp. MIT060901]|uniref:D-glycero-beta-D-manno-heptose-7-phosphate kinase n=1 Tax=Maricaulis sp. MIT060901 TaxID=3096993 RepID=UPI00399A3C1A
MSRSSEWIEAFRGRKLVVFGDVMLDRYTFGDSTRISPEAPAPVFKAERVDAMIGGAGNVARNIVSLGGKAVLIGAIGADAAGRELQAAIEAEDGLSAALAINPDMRTAVKNRYVAKNQQMLRVDEEDVGDQPDSVVADMMSSLATALDGASALVISDYAKGVLTEDAIARACAIANDRNLPVVVDPKARDLSRYRGATVVTPNAKETEEATGLSCVSDAGAEAAARAIAQQVGCPMVVVTRGPQGMTVRNADDGITHLPTAAQEVFDVSGAGDTVVAALALGLGSGLAVEDAAELANRAAGVVVAKVGTATASAAELHIAMHGTAPDGRLTVSLDGAVAATRAWQAQGQSVVFSNGCFDLLHPGHVSLLAFAREQGDKLIVAINSDASVKRLKGPSRPVQDEDSRALVMEALRFVDLVVIFNEDTPLEAITAIQPDVLVKGADYKPGDVVGGDVVTGRGGRIALAPLVDGQSTTAAIARANGPENV